MPGLSAADVLDVWERGSALAPARRAVALLSAARGEPEEEVAGLSVASRDAALLDLRTRLFGSATRATVECPRCDETLDLEIDLARLTRTDRAPVDSVSTGEFEITFRLPSTTDALEAEPARDRRLFLLERCVVASHRGEEEVSVRDLPEDVVAAVESTMAHAEEPVTLALSCAGCGHTWSERLDPAPFLWEEVTALAGRLVADVHVLASAYGWSEDQVLALSSARRRLYVEVVAE
jgi:hypothetical protein